MKFDVVIVAGGNSTRAGLNKMHFSFGNLTALERTVEAFFNVEEIENIILVLNEKDLSFGESIKENYIEKNIITVLGGNTRSQSVLNGLKKCLSPAVLIHDGARPFIEKSLIERVTDGVERFGSAIPALPINDSVRKTDGDNIIGEINRDDLKAVQTPQGFMLKDILKAYEKGDMATDESALYAKYIAPPHVVMGSERNLKLTSPEDFTPLKMKIGLGYDLHRLVPFKKFMLGGIELEHDLGALAHSDGDVIIHAIIDALLGAIGKRDIGTLFPDNDPKYLDIDSAIMLTEVIDMLKKDNFRVKEVHVVVILEKPKLKDVIPLMRIKLARLMEIDTTAITISAKTNEGIGSIGEGLAVAAYATAVIF